MAQTSGFDAHASAHPLPSRSKVDATAIQPADSHRGDIDGLRALAVVSVVLLHGGVSAISGGFLGVDVFFVISGYLIHKDLTRRLAAGTFSPFAFYGRRMRRTLPALYLVTATTLVTGWFVLLPGDFDAAARSAVATALSLSNILFLNQVGYFDHDALSKPLLHTWSLGVEEQFYLLAPLFSLALSRVRFAQRLYLYVGLFIVTFGACVAVQRTLPAAAFFLMPTRAWEFLIGCAIADGLLPRVRSHVLAEVVTATALAMLIGSFFLVSDGSAHPGLPTLIPCVATAAIIATGETRRSMVARLLGLRPIAFVGLISYSLYLWHWPLIVFARYREIPVTPMAGALLLTAAVALSIASWRYVERPFRDPASPWRWRAQPVMASALGLIVLGSSGIVLAHGVPQRFPDDVAKITSYYDYANRREFREGTCFLTTKYGSLENFDKATCLKRSVTKPNYLLIGDSLAAQYWIGLSTIYRDANILQATASGCRPTLHASGKTYCLDLMSYAFEDVLPTAHLDGIVFAAAWQTDDGALMAETVAYAKKFTPNVTVLGSLPYYDLDLPNLLGRSMIAHRPAMVPEHRYSFPWDVEALFESRIGAANFMAVLPLVCPQRVCIERAAPTVPLQFDKIHLTSEGSIRVARMLRAAGLFRGATEVGAAPAVAGAP